MFSLIANLRNLAVRQHMDSVRMLHVSTVVAAARKGTREKARKKKVKVDKETKTGWTPRIKRDKIAVNHVDKHLTDITKPPIPTDNVWASRYHRSKVFTAIEAIQAHRETHHPTIMNRMDEPIIAHIELNMRAEKKTRTLDNFRRTAMIPHKFELKEERKVIVFTKGEKEIAEASASGATLIGGAELVKQITNGEISLLDYQAVLAHPNILPELVAMRGILKRRFPNVRNGTLSANISEMVHKFSNGINYSAEKDEYQPDFGLTTATIGYVNMDPKKLEENLQYLLQDINTVRPKRAGRFVTRVYLKCPPSTENFLIDPFVYIPETHEGFPAETDESAEVAQSEDGPVEEEAVASASSN